MEIGLLVISHLVVLAFGALEGPKIVTFVGGLFAKVKASRALADAQKVITKAEADAKALEAARKVVAAAPKPVVATGATGPTGAA